MNSALPIALAISIVAVTLPALAEAQTVGKPSPRGDPASWVRKSDYPLVAINQRMQGVTSFVLDVNEKGVVTHCTITGSSGYAVLDESTCNIFMTRGKFNPARDEHGAAVKSTWRTNFHWDLPRP